MPELFHSAKPPFMHWKPETLIRRLGAGEAIESWLTTPGSLTRRIRAHCPGMQVTVLSEAWERPLASEARALDLPLSEKAWVRCVLLRCAEQNWVYARTVIPDMNAGNPWRTLQALGNKPLGEVLFELRNIRRSGFEFNRQKLQEWPFPARALEKEIDPLQNAWARRSRFFQKQHPLLLTEVFLPDLLSEPASTFTPDH